MAVAVTGMHYVGMVAAVFIQKDHEMGYIGTKISPQDSFYGVLVSANICLWVLVILVLSSQRKLLNERSKKLRKVSKLQTAPCITINTHNHHLQQAEEVIIKIAASTSTLNSVDFANFYLSSRSSNNSGVKASGNNSRSLISSHQSNTQKSHGKSSVHSKSSRNTRNYSASVVPTNDSDLACIPEADHKSQNQQDLPDHDMSPQTELFTINKTEDQNFQQEQECEV